MSLPSEPDTMSYTTPEIRSYNGNGNSAKYRRLSDHWCMHSDQN